MGRVIDLHTTTFVTKALFTRRAPGFSAKEFLAVSDLMNMAPIRLSIRYPESGCTRNSTSEMLVYIVSGKVELSIKNGNLWVKKTAHAGMQVFIPKGALYFWKPIKSVFMIVTASPPWSADNQERIETF